ncbi:MULTISPECIES: IclR family transcriptional regulator [Actinomadura]|uniref:DNA-binding transcriptional regulator, IclR family n=1 Tax=Actinomadura madurae TaxID=1993 RepID=A0A1I5RHP6_9ACTN|nr:IclR family transcriptional regulator [Actinomadura madurae]SFP57890.1 DNA-binding transcriptional regulator, IclR family [Actinomadura madurae]
MTLSTPNMRPAGRDPDSGRPIGSLERAAALLGAFGEGHRELSLAELVQRSGLPRSTVHRTATRMIELGWLDKPRDRYRIGNRLFELSGLVPVRHELREAVLPFLQDLYAAARTTVQLGVLEGAQVLVVEKITGHRRMPMLAQVGGTIPAHCSALGRAILAWSDAGALDTVLAAGLERRTPRTITSPDALRRELATVAERGWAHDREEGNIGVCCVAAPIFGPGGGVAAALSVTGPGRAVREEYMVPAVRMAAAAAGRAYSTRRWETPRTRSATESQPPGHAFGP